MWRYRRQPGMAFWLLGELQRQQLSNHLLCDTVLQSGGCSVPVHSCILAAFSPFLSRELSSAPPCPWGQRRVIPVPAIGPHTLLTLISYLYTGELNGRGAREHEEIRAALIKLGMSRLIHQFEDDASRNRQTTERGIMRRELAVTEEILLTELEVDAVKTTKAQVLPVRGTDQATQTEFEPRINAATQTNAFDASTLCHSPPIIPDPKPTRLVSLEKSPTHATNQSSTASTSTLAILSFVNNLPLSSSNTLHTSQAPSPFDMDHPPRLNLGGRVSAEKNTLTEDGVESETQHQGKRIKMDQSNACRAADCEMEQTVRDQNSKNLDEESPKQVKVSTAVKPSSALKFKLKRKSKKSLWAIENAERDPNLVLAQEICLETCNVSCKNPILQEQSTKTTATSFQNTTSPSMASSPHFVRNVDPLAPQVSSPKTLPSSLCSTSSSLGPPQPEDECDEQIDRLLEDIIMDMDLRLFPPPITSDRRGTHSRHQQGMCLPPVVDSECWPPNAEASHSFSHQQEPLAAELHTEPTTGPFSPGEYTTVRENPHPTSHKAPLDFPQKGASDCVRPMSVSASSNKPHIPILNEIRLPSCLSPLRSEDEGAAGSARRRQSRPVDINRTPLVKGQTSAPLNFPPWLSLKPIDLRFPLHMTLKDDVTDDPNQDVEQQALRQNSGFVKTDMATASEKHASEEVCKMTSSNISKVQTTKQSLVQKRSIAEKEKGNLKRRSVQKSLRNTTTKQNCPVKQIGSKQKGFRRSTVVKIGEMSARLVAKRRRHDSHGKSSTMLEAMSSPGVPKRKRGRPPKSQSESNTLPLPLKKTDTVTISQRSGVPQAPCDAKQAQVPLKKKEQIRGEKSKIDNTKLLDVPLKRSKSDGNRVQSSQGAVPKLLDTVRKLDNANSMAPVPTIVVCTPPLTPLLAAGDKISSNTSAPSQTLKRFKELLERKRKKDYKANGKCEVLESIKKRCENYNYQRKQDSWRPEPSIHQGKALSEQTNDIHEQALNPASARLPQQNRLFTAPGSFEPKNQLKAPVTVRFSKNSKAQHDQKWSDSSFGSCDEQEEDGTELEVDVLSGSPRPLPPVDYSPVLTPENEELEEDVDIVTVDTD